MVDPRMFSEAKAQYMISEKLWRHGMESASWG